MLILKQAVSSMFKLGLWMIPITAVFAVVAFFFAGIIFSMDVTFVGFWRKSYIAVMIALITFDMLRVLLFYLASIYYTRLWKVPYSVYEEAIIKYQILKDVPKEVFNAWTPEEFKEKFWIAETSTDLARFMAESFMKSKYEKRKRY